MINYELREKINTYLLKQRNEQGVWEGRLSSSALSTSLAVFALWKYNAEHYQKEIELGLNWLVQHINPDGGWGDTIRSESNLSTTLLTWSTFSIVEGDQKYKASINKAENWLQQRLKGLDGKSISEAILNHYKSDQTFSVPILAMCALSGKLGKEGWKYVPQLPYQMAIFPDSLFKWLNLSVVSYAIPALISIGMIKAKNTKQSKLIKAFNDSIEKKVLDKLAKKQPENGGFLEATPLTAFVLMSLIGAGKKENIVCKKAVAFLEESIREDGSWPIDTHLSTWVTSLSVNALGADHLNQQQAEELVNYYMNSQWKQTHPFTQAKAGGWAWTHLQGGVPDADDTSGALIALYELNQKVKVPIDSIAKAVTWLMQLQNSDGGIPTFCKGWGKLPFDCSCPDITAHAMKAIALWREHLPDQQQRQSKKFLKKAWNYLKSIQHTDGSFSPLWFGNEEEERHQNPVYGSSIVLYSLSVFKADDLPDLMKIKKKIVRYLESAQNADGAWGGAHQLSSSIEETALAVRALAKQSDSCKKGLEWLYMNVPQDVGRIKATPIGLYFASLWYYEDLYPLSFLAGALRENV